jgi:hypothetical protein
MQPNTNKFQYNGILYKDVDDIIFEYKHQLEMAEVSKDINKYKMCLFCTKRNIEPYISYDCGHHLHKACYEDEMTPWARAINDRDGYHKMKLSCQICMCPNIENLR